MTTTSHKCRDDLCAEAERVDARELDNGITSDTLIKATFAFHKAAKAFVAATKARHTLRYTAEYSMDYVHDVLSDLMDDDYGALVLSAFEAAAAEANELAVSA
jgi:hypothetical protein